MAYATQTWTDSVTPVDKAHMDHIEAGISTADANASTALARVQVPAVVNGQWVKGVGGAAVWSAIASTDVDWFALPFALTYSSTDGHTFVCTTAGDMTALISVGARIRLTDAAATKYFIVTAITAATITLYGGQNYTLAGGAITVPFYSQHKAPLGFPLDPTIWTELLSDTVDRTVITTTLGTWYAVPSVSLAVPIGAWRLGWSGIIGQSGTAQSIALTLASVTASQTDSDLTAGASFGSAPTFPMAGREKSVVLAAKTTWNINVKNVTGGGGPSAGFYAGSFTIPTIIRAVCNYL